LKKGVKNKKYILVVQIHNKFENLTLNFFFKIQIQIQIAHCTGAYKRSGTQKRLGDKKRLGAQKAPRSAKSA
jgi:ADP-heptose:LPS heptosyltransferase